MTTDLLLTRDEVLGGLPAKRAAALLFLIESRTAHLVERARHTMKPFRTEEADRERELAFVEAFALGREPPLRPTIQDLERHASQWADLIPENPRLRAAVAHLLGQKYQFTGAAVPALRNALGLDGETVQQAYQRLYRQPLDTIFTRRPSPTVRLRWAMAGLGGWLESLPPFWTAFALTLTETVGAGVLALPIALAGVGPLAGIVLILMLGLVNVITIAWMAETAARTASIRYGGAYFGRLVTEYLGSAGALLLTVALVIISSTVLLAYAIGLSTTLASATGVAAAVWIALLFAVVGYMVSRDSIHSTVASALGIGAVNLTLVLVLAALGFAHVTSANLTHMQVPGLGGVPFEFSFLGLIFGVVLCSFFGHTSVGNCAAVVLQRDPSARSLIWGVVAAQVTAIAVYSVWVLGINGAIAPDALTGHAGTALEPLATVAGPAVYIFGSIFVVLAMGMGSIHMALGLVNVVRERLPKRSKPVVLLPRREGRLVFEPRGSVDGTGSRLVLTYLGLTGGEPRFRVQAKAAGRTQRLDRSGSGPWNARDALDRLPDNARDELDLTVETITANEDQVRLQIASGMRMRYEGAWATDGLDLASLLDVDATAADPGPDWSLLRWMLRTGEVSLADVAIWSGEDEHRTQERLQTLVERGAVREIGHNGAITYRAQFARRRARHVPEGVQQGTGESSAPVRHFAGWTAAWGRARRTIGRIVGDRALNMLEYSPLLFILLFAEWLVITDRASFTRVLSFVGVIAVPIFAGLFPCLLLVSSRRKGDLVPGMVARFLGRPWLTISVYTLFLVAILLHGLVIWEQLVERATALVAGIIMFGVTVLAIRRGAFTPRTVVLLREDRRPGGDADFEIVSGGYLATADAWLDYADGVRHVQEAIVETRDFASLRQITANLPGDPSPDIKVWANRITPEGDIESLPATVRLTCGVEEHEVDLRLAGGQALMSRNGNPCAVAITLDQPTASPKDASKGESGEARRVDVQSLLSLATDPDTPRTKGNRP